MTNDKQFVLAVDLDDTVFEYIQGFRKYLCQTRACPPSNYPDPISWSLAESGWGFVDDDEFFKVHAEAVEAGLFRELDARVGSASALWRLRQQGVKIKIVTHRFVVDGLQSKIVADTAYALEKNDIFYDDLIFTGDKDQVQADLFIEDSPRHLLALDKAKKRVVKCVMPYNKNIPVGHPTTHWGEIEMYVNYVLRTGLYE